MKVGLLPQEYLLKLCPLEGTVCLLAPLLLETEMIRCITDWSECPPPAPAD